MGSPEQGRFSFQLLTTMESIINRRVFFKIASTGVAGYFVSPLQTMAQTVTTTPGAAILGTARNCIFVLLAGGPSHMDTLDLRVGSWTPADFAPTTINGIDFPNGLLPNLGTQLNFESVLHHSELPVDRACPCPAPKLESDCKESCKRDRKDCAQHRLGCGS